jgi:PHD/YefM family antitoxin component YafN of YafNO toxin-antitoxin module
VNEIDETEYLFRSPENKQRLLQAIEDVEQGINLIHVPMSDIEKLA